MKKTINVKLLLIVLSVLFLLSGAMLFATRAEDKKASAATAITAVSMAKGSTENGFYRYEITLTGYTAVSDYRKYNKEVAADGVVLPDYVELNGKSVTAWNTEYAATADSWTFEKFPTTAAGYYYHMPIFFQGSGSGYIKMYIHTQMYNAIKAEYGLVDIRVRKGLNLENGSYTLDFDSSIFVIKSDRTIVPISDASITQVAATDVNVNVSRWQVNSDLYYFDVYFPGFGASSDYNIMKPAQSAYYYISSIIHVNGVSAKYINEHTDVSGYSAWNVFPQTSGDARYLKPFLFYSSTNGMLNVRMKNDWWNANKVNNAMTISFVPHVYVTRADGDGGGIYTMAEEVKFIRDSAIGESSYTAAGWKDLRNSAVVITESNANRPYSPSEKTWYFKVNFAGFTTTGYDAVNVAAVNDNILINGKSISEINENTNTTGWTWAKFPQNAVASYAKPILNYVGENGVMQMQMHENLYNALKAEYGLIDITFKSGFTFGGYTVSDDCKFVLNSDNVVVWLNDSSINKVVPTINTWGIQQDLYYFFVNFAGFESSIGYNVMKSDKAAYYFSNLIHVNGVSAKYINENTDVSGYSSWGVFPQSADAIYRKPFLFYGDADGKMTVKIKNDWWNANKFGNAIEVSVVPHVYVTTSGGDIYCVENEVVYLRDGSIDENTASGSGWIDKSTLTEVSASGISIFVDNNANRPYSQSEYTYYFKIGFSGFTTTGQYDMYNTRNVTDYIKINDKTLTEITAETDVSGWTWGKFPQNADSKYHLPVLNYVSSAGTLQMQMHENLFFSLQGVKITVCKGLNMNGYILTEDKEMIFKEASDGSSSTFINESDITYIYPSEISISRWQPLNDVIYFDINYAPFNDGTNYKMMDNSAYYYFANLIYINGMSMRYWNLRTDVSGYSTWQTFPSSGTGAGTYNKPFVTLISNGKMEVRMKLDWWNANKGAGNSIEIAVVPGTFITKNDILYGVKEAAVFYSDPAFDGYTTAAWPNAYGYMENGAYVRMTTDSTSGLRFCAHLNESLIQALEAKGATVKYMMKLNRAGSSVDFYKECTVYYVEDGVINYNVVITGIADYSKAYTAQPFLRITYADSHVEDMYLGSLERSITYVANAALSDYSNSQTEKYQYAFIVGGETKYSPYTNAQREILEGYASLTASKGVIYTYEKETSGFQNTDSFLMESVGEDADKINEFFDDYKNKFLYHNSGEYITSSQVGNTSMGWRSWDSMAISYIHSTNISSNDAANGVKIGVTSVVDKYGYVWEGSEDGFFAQGWEYAINRSYTWREDGNSAFELDGWEFLGQSKKSSILDADAGATGRWGACNNNWTINADYSGFNASQTDINDGEDGKGYYYVDVPDTKTTTHNVVFSVSESSNNGVFVASICKFVEIRFKTFIRSGSISSVTFGFKNGSGSSYTLDLATWATTPFGTIGTGDGEAHLFIPVFEHANWTGNIKEISITFNGTYTGYIWLDFVRGCFDVRMADTNAAFINGGRMHFEHTGDTTFLASNLTNYRKAMQFLISYMTDANGIINLSNLQGHDGGTGYANSLISTYWDLISLAPNSSYVNSLYYKALLDMAYLEEAVAINGISVAAPTVKTTLTGSNITYSETASSLRSKAAALKTAINAAYNAGSHTGYFKTIDATHGYFIDGWRDSTEIDFQSVAFNLMMIDTGIVSDEHAEMILNWIDSLSGVYDFVFAPRSNMVTIGEQVVWNHGATTYGGYVEDGGAILFLSYYDIKARLKYKGAEDAYARLEAIIDWYSEVKAAYEASGETDPENFFKPYYEGSGITFQGGLYSGTLGLDSEFVENVILMSVVPYGFFGLSSEYDTTDNKAVLKIQPSLPDEIAVWKIEDVRFLGVDFDIVVADSFVIIQDVDQNITGGTLAKAKIQITLHYTGTTPNVYLNGNLITSGYTVDTTNKTITYTSSSPFAALTLVVK